MGLFWAKYARRIFAIVSTTSIPNLAPVSPTEATVDPPSRGSRLDADHPENGVLIPCVFTAKERAIRRRQLKRLWARLKQLSTMKISREELLMKLGAATRSVAQRMAPGRH